MADDSYEEFRKRRPLEQKPAEASLEGGSMVDRAHARDAAEQAAQKPSITQRIGAKLKRESYLDTIPEGANGEASFANLSVVGAKSTPEDRLAAVKAIHGPNAAVYVSPEGSQDAGAITVAIPRGAGQEPRTIIYPAANGLVPGKAEAARFAGEGALDVATSAVGGALAGPPGAYAGGIVGAVANPWVREAVNKQLPGGSTQSAWSKVGESALGGGLAAVLPIIGPKALRFARTQLNRGAAHIPGMVGKSSADYLEQQAAKKVSQAAGAAADELGIGANHEGNAEARRSIDALKSAGMDEADIPAGVVRKGVPSTGRGKFNMAQDVEAEAERFDRMAGEKGVLEQGSPKPPTNSEAPNLEMPDLPGGRQGAVARGKIAEQALENARKGAYAAADSNDVVQHLAGGRNPANRKEVNAALDQMAEAPHEVPGQAIPGASSRGKKTGRPVWEQHPEFKDSYERGGGKNAFEDANLGQAPHEAPKAAPQDATGGGAGRPPQPTPNPTKRDWSEINLDEEPTGTIQYEEDKAPTWADQGQAARPNTIPGRGTDNPGPAVNPPAVDSGGPVPPPRPAGESGLPPRRQVADIPGEGPAAHSLSTSEAAQSQRLADRLHAELKGPLNPNIGASKLRGKKYTSAVEDLAKLDPYSAQKVREAYAGRLLDEGRRIGALNPKQMDQIRNVLGKDANQILDLDAAVKAAKGGVAAAGKAQAKGVRAPDQMQFFAKVFGAKVPIPGMKLGMERVSAAKGLLSSPPKLQKVMRDPKARAELMKIIAYGRQADPSDPKAVQAVIDGLSALAGTESQR